MAKKALDPQFPPQNHDHEQCVDDAMAAAEALCRDRGARLTEIRKRVLELVWQRHGPVGAYDILDSLRDENRRAQPPTVYRALDFLIEHGLIHRIESLNAYVGCAHPGQGHHGQFLICHSCRRVGEMDDPDIASLVAEKAKKLGFAAIEQTVEISGLCPDCRDPAS